MGSSSEMTVLGWIFMIVTWAIVLSALGFCWWKITRIKKKKNF